MKHIKYLLGKTGGNWKKFRNALQEWRNTPRSVDGLNELGDNDNDLRLLLWLMLMEKYLIWSLKTP